MRSWLRLAVGMLALVGAASCASWTLAIRRAAEGAATRLADVRLPVGTECIVQLASGETVRGRLERITEHHIELNVRDEAVVHRESLAHADVVMLAKVVKMSKAKRGWVGAAVAAAVSVPFGISTIGDMVVPAAILGALIGRGTGDSRAEIVFERLPVPQ